VPCLTTFPKLRPTSLEEHPLIRFRHNFNRTRKRVATKLSDPRFLQIAFHTFRHWKATMLYHKTKDIICVKEHLGHQDVRNTLLYVRIENAIFQETSDDFVCKVAKTIEDAKQLIEVGFEYVTDMDGFKLFRKRK